MENLAEDKKRSKIKLYFTKPTLLKPIILILIGLALWGRLLALNIPGIVSYFIILVGGIWLYIGAKPLFDSPTDKVIDGWLLEDIENLKKRSLERLNIDGSELIREESLVIKSPRLWTIRGIYDREITYRKGKDRIIRFSVYHITILHFTEHKLSSYQCDYNCIRGVPINEQDDEYFYKDVVSVATRDETTNYTLPNNVIMKHSQAFVLSASSGDNIKVVVGSEELIKFANGSLPETGVDTAIRAIRRVLTEKKI